MRAITSPMATGSRQTRRRFLQCAAASVALPLLSTANAQEAAAPSRGGHFKLGVNSGSSSDSLDPATYSDNYMQSVGHALHGYLVEIDADGELRPDLAESWEPGADASEWRFRLRTDAEFHDGRPVRVEDVVAAMNHHRGEGSTSAAKTVLDPVEDITVDGRDVVFRLSAGNADFPFLLSDYHLAVLPSTDGVAEADTGVGCGAYRLAAFQPGLRTMLERDPNHWRDDRGFFESAEVLAIADTSARTNALITGEIHAMNGLELRTAHLLERDQALEIYSLNGGQHYTLPMNTQVTPFNDRNVRLALKYAIDREALLAMLLSGYGAVGNDHPLTPGYRFFDASLPQRGYDPDRARHHLRQAGHERLRVDLSASDAAFAGAIDAATLFREHAQAAGIDVNIVREPADGYWSNVWMQKPFCMSYWGGKPTADWALTVGYAEDAAWNDTNWRNDEFNRLLREARSELNEGRRAEMYARMQSILHEDGGAIIPVFANYTGAIRREEIGHRELASNWDLDGLRCIERWWMKTA
jgi:peptide/nickel transport system substrate-binding protein